LSSQAANISIDCPGCGRRFNIAPQYAGRRAKCHLCGTILTVPTPARPEEYVYQVAGEPEKRPPPLPAAGGVSTLDYSTPATKTADRERRKKLADPPNAGSAVDLTKPHVRIDPADPFVGNKFKNLYLPLMLMFGAILFDITSQVIFSTDKMFDDGIVEGRPSGFIVGPKMAMVSLATHVPGMLIACFLAVRLFGDAFGSLWPAILKLCSITLSLEGMIGLGATIGWTIGMLSGSEWTRGAATELGIVFGALSGLGLYCWLFIYYFDLETGEVWHLIMLIWFVQTAAQWGIAGWMHSHHHFR
jgi:hypothetical protein